MKQMQSKMVEYLLLFVCFCVPFMEIHAEADAVKPEAEPAKTEIIKNETVLHAKPSLAPEKIEAYPTTSDEQISNRLKNILMATGWFNNPQIEVENGVVFMTGETHHHEFKDWAEKLAHNTKDVTAIVNKISVLEPSIVDLHIIAHELVNQGRKILRSMPVIIFGGLILFVAWMLARLVYKLIPILLRNKMNPSLLQDVIARALSFFVFLIGVYFVFEMAELTTMALTVISGTGLLGIILGIAFRDLAENFLASILLSVQNPFRTNDLIDLIAPNTGYTITGYVERLTLRATLLVSPDGNHVQIPNATVYKSNIVNHTSNPNHREMFSVTIKHNCSLSKAVDSALKVLLENEAVLKKPEPLVLVESLGEENVDLKVCYWIDIKKTNGAKVKSSLVRLIKQVFQGEGIYQISNDPNDPTEPGEELVEHYEAKTTKSEAKTKGDAPLEKIQGISVNSRPPEEENLLDKASNVEKENKKAFAAINN